MKIKFLEDAINEFRHTLGGKAGADVYGTHDSRAYFGSNNLNYYSHYDANTFFSIANLWQKITKASVNVDLLNAAIFWFTNIERAKFNLKQFKFHKKLRQTAIWHSEQMKVHNFFCHDNGFDPRYRTLTDRINSVQDGNFKGFTCWGENIADYPIIKANETFTVRHINGIPCFFSASGTDILPYSYYVFARIVVEGWMNSPGHRANILNPNYEYLGCGCANYEKIGNDYKMLYFKLTQNFGGSLVPDNFLSNILNF